MTANIVTYRRYLRPPPPSTLDIVAWGEYTTSGGISIDTAEAFNASVAGASTVDVTGYYQPEYLGGGAYQAAYPGIASSPTAFDPNGYALTEVSPAIPLSLSSGDWKDFDALVNAYPVAVNSAIVARLLVDGSTEIYAVVLTSAGI